LQNFNSSGILYQSLFISVWKSLKNFKYSNQKRGEEKMKTVYKIKNILALHKLLAVAFCLTLLVCSLAYGADSISEREHDSRQGAIQGISRAPIVQPEYILDVSDIIEVDVWRNEELSRKLKIRPDGRISLPLAGEIKASGLTPQQLSDVIARKLEAKYILDPQVTVIVHKVESKHILVLGNVNKPGLFNVDGKITALQAIARAGGSTKYAHTESTLIVRNPYSMQPAIYNIDLHSAVTEGKFANDMLLQPGDVVYVPKSFLGKVVDVMGFFRDNIKPGLDSYINYRQAETIDDYYNN
jgi:polysaccharide export outer membrane protein